MNFSISKSLLLLDVISKQKHLSFKKFFLKNHEKNCVAGLWGRFFAEGNANYPNEATKKTFLGQVKWAEFYSTTLDVAHVRIVVIMAWTWRFAIDGSRTHDIGFCSKNCIQRYIVLLLRISFVTQVAIVLTTGMSTKRSDSSVSRTNHKFGSAMETIVMASGVCNFVHTIISCQNTNLQQHQGYIWCLPLIECTLANQLITALKHA